MTAPVSLWRRWRASHRQLRDLHLQVARLSAENNNLGKSLRDARNKHLAAELAAEKLGAQLATVRRIAADQSTTPADALARIMAALMEGESPEAGEGRG